MDAQTELRSVIFSSCERVRKLTCSKVWSPDGTLLGKFVVEVSSPSNLGTAEMIFVSNPNGLVILAETKMYFAQIAAKGIPLTGPS